MLTTTLFVAAMAAGALFDDVKIPRDGTETSLIRVKAEPRKHFGPAAFKIVGGVEIDDYYNYGYQHRERDFYSLKFREAGEHYRDDLGDRAQLYLSRKTGEKIVEKLAALHEKDKRGMTLIRTSVKLNAQKYASDKQWDMLEVDDVQFFDPETFEWGEWEIATARKAREEKEAAERAESERLKAIRDKAEAESAARIKASADKRAADAKVVRDEKSAEAKLKSANDLLKAGKRDSFKKTLRELIEKYPDTKAAQKAKELLK